MKKILCLVMATVMMFSCASVGMTASALDPILRPADVANVIDPIRLATSTSFATTIDDIGYASVDSYAEAGKTITKDTFDAFITKYADDKMFGVDFDLLYSKDNSAFLWNALDQKLEVVIDDNDDTDNDVEIINGILSGTGKDASDFVREWNSKNLDRAYTVHDVEMYKAFVNNTSKTSCTKKGAYDACGAVLSSYDLYDAKEMDTATYKSIIETAVAIVNPFTNRTETHYEYSYRFPKGDFGLVRANSNNLLAQYIGAAWGDGAIYATPALASENAIKLANFIGKLIDPQFKERSADPTLFTDNKKISRETFFEKVTVLSGLDIFLDTKWCNAKGFDVRDIMSALGVNTNDDVIFDAELTKGSKMGARILSDIYKGFTSDPMGYVLNLTQLFCKNYTLSYKRALSELFSEQFNEILSKSRSAKYAELDSYKGTELNSAEGFFNFIADCIYVNKVDSGERSAKNFSFAPMPVKRFASAADMNELYLYAICYFELNRIYENNGSIINTAIDKFVLAVGPAGDKDKNGRDDLVDVLRGMFCGEITLLGMNNLQLGVLTEELITNASDNIMSTIKKALAGFVQRFIDAFDNLMNLLFGWTDGILKK